MPINYYWYESNQTGIKGYSKHVSANNKSFYGYPVEPSYKEFEKYDLRFFKEGTSDNLLSKLTGGVFA